VLFLGFAMMPGRASSHREAPLISADPQADTTDVYALINGFALNRQPVDRDMVLWTRAATSISRAPAAVRFRARQTGAWR